MTDVWYFVDGLSVSSGPATTPVTVSSATECNLAFAKPPALGSPAADQIKQCYYPERDYAAFYAKPQLKPTKILHQEDPAQEKGKLKADSPQR